MPLSSRHSLWLVPCIAFYACSSNDDRPSSSAAGASGGSLATGGGSAVATGGTESDSGGTGDASGGSPTASGGTPATGGASSGGAPSSGGSQSEVGGAGGQAPVPGDLTLASALNQRIEVPCQSYEDGSELCPAAMTLPPINSTMGGDSSLTYAVTLRLRGLVEPHTFSGPSGSLEQETAAPYFITSSEGTPDDIPYALFSIQVAEPALTYYANAFYTIDGEFHHRLFAIDYTAELRVRGGATVTFRYADGNDEQVANFNDVVVPGVPPAPAVFNGQFLQFDVVAVAEVP
jgi:hypothetical protein